MKTDVMLAIGVGVAGLAGAVGVAEPTELPELVVTPLRLEQPAAETPYSVGVVSGETARLELQSRTLPDMLEETPGVWVQKTAHGQGSPYIRGFTGFRNLMLVDGIRLNNSVFRDGPNQYWNTVDPLAVDRLEVVRGPGSVLYGSDAIGGTVNAIGQVPDFSQAGWRNALYGRYASAEDAWIGRAETRGTQGRLGATAGVSIKRFGDLEGGEDTGELPNTGYDEYDLDVKAVYRFNDDTRLTLAHQTVDQDDAWRTHRTIYSKSFEGTTVGSDKRFILDQSRHLTYARLNLDHRPGAVSGGELTLSWQQQNEDQDRTKKDDTRDKQGLDVDTLGAALVLRSPTRWAELLYGGEWYHDAVDSYGRKYKDDGSLKSLESQGPVADDAAYDTAGLFAEADAPLGERVDLVLGTRVAYAAVAADDVKDPVAKQFFDLDEDWTAWVNSGRLIVDVLPGEGLRAYGGISQGFRAPNLSDLTRFDIARTDEIETPVQDLDPEHYLTYEIGLRLTRERVASELALYRTEIDDMIVRAPTGRVVEDGREVTKRNAGDGWVHGLEWSGRVRLAPSWSVFGDVSWVDGEVDGYPTSEPVQQTEPLDKLMPALAHAGLRWDEASGKLWAEALVTGADDADKLNAAGREDTQRIPPGGTPSYTVGTLRGGWRATEDLTLAVAVENITDEDYRIHGSGVNEPGRNFIVSAEFAF